MSNEEEIIKSLDNAVDHINHESYCDALSSISEAKELIRAPDDLMCFLACHVLRSEGFSIRENSNTVRKNLDDGIYISNISAEIGKLYQAYKLERDAK